jgi:predicted N-acyltransferase
VTGRRLLVAPGEDKQSVQQALLGGLFNLAKKTDASSLHILFCTAEECEEVGALSGMSRRKTFQFHWTNPGVKDFEQWLGLMRSRKRKTIRRERRIAQELGVDIQILRGEALSPTHWEALEGFYRDTVDRKFGQAYLRPEFFREARSQLSHLALGILAFKDGEVQAGALAFQRGDHLYGRYWGCRPGYGRLHFEICYHQPIALCLKHNWTRFEAGAQGEHKISRGLLPVTTHSLHWIRHPGLAGAMERANRAEQAHTEGAIKWLGAHGPFRRQSPDGASAAPGPSS